MSSIVNKPNKRGLMTQLTSISFLKKRAKENVQNFGSGKYVYKNLKENDITESLHIPAVEWPRDFSKSLNQRQHVEAEYLFA